MDVIGLQITTAGSGSEPAILQFKKDHDSESGLYLQGLCDRVAEDLAEYIHNLLRKRVGLKKGRDGQRYSPGYPAIVDLINNKTIWERLEAHDIGVSLTDANEFDPPSSTAAVICFHKEASYS
jgi:5-methyltetrahydrofolate--homocysteine methyltransferase